MKKYRRSFFFFFRLMTENHVFFFSEQKQTIIVLKRKKKQEYKGMTRFPFNKGRTKSKPCFFVTSCSWTELLIGEEPLS